MVCRHCFCSSTHSTARTCRLRFYLQLPTINDICWKVLQVSGNRTAGLPWWIFVNQDGQSWQMSLAALQLHSCVRRQ